MNDAKGLNKVLAVLGAFALLGLSGCGQEAVIETDSSIQATTEQTSGSVNEEGAEAAAVTSVGIIRTSLPPSIRIDRPFVFMIREKSSNAILFIGKLMTPQ